MVIRNITQKKLLTSDAKVATSFVDQVLGLHRKSNPRSLVFYTRFGIHTFFLKTPIDVVILNNKNQIVKIKENLQPNKLFLWNPKYWTIIELPKGTIHKSKTLLFDTLSLSTV